MASDREDWKGEGTVPSRHDDAAGRGRGAGEGIDTTGRRSRPARGACCGIEDIIGSRRFVPAAYHQSYRITLWTIDSSKERAEKSPEMHRSRPARTSECSMYIGRAICRAATVAAAAAVVVSCQCHRRRLNRTNGRRAGHCRLAACSGASRAVSGAANGVVCCRSLARAATRTTRRRGGE